MLLQSFVSLECPDKSRRILVFDVARLVPAHEVGDLVGQVVTEQLDADVQEEEDAHQEGHSDLNLSS